MAVAVEKRWLKGLQLGEMSEVRYFVEVVHEMADDPQQKLSYDLISRERF